MKDNTYIYLLLMALVTFVIRVLPLTLIRKPIKNRFIRSFLYYVPYVTLTVMTFPAIVQATDSIWAGVASLVFGVVASWLGLNMVGCAGLCCLIVFVIDLLF